MTLTVSSIVLDLTPRRPVTLGGFAGAPRISSGHHSNLEANIVVFSDSSQAVVLVALDLLFVGCDLRRAIEIAACKALDVSPAHVVIIASHTHYAPMLDRLKPPLGALDEAELARWSDTLTAAFGRLSAPVHCDRVERGRGESFAATNRRKRWPWPNLARALGRTHGGMYIADNPAGPIDRSIRTWLWASGGRPVAIVWAFACHPTGYPESGKISSEFPGVVRATLRERFGADLPVIYAPTCMGDVRPRTGPRRRGLRRAVDLAVYGPRAGGFDVAEWEAWAGGLARDVSGTLAGSEGEPIANSAIVVSEVSIPTSQLVEGRCPTGEFVCKAVRLPGLGRMTTLSCEPVTGVGPLIGQGVDLVAGYEGDVFGYLPVDHMLKEGGYEAGGYFPAFGMTGKFKPGIDDLLQATGARLAAGIAQDRPGVP